MRTHHKAFAGVQLPSLKTQKYLFHVSLTNSEKPPKIGGFVLSCTKKI